jgi:acetate kinase
VRSSSPFVLTINGGSSSIRFAIYEARDPLLLQLKGKIDRIGLHGTKLVIKNAGESAQELPVPGKDQHTATEYLLRWLEQQPAFARLGAVGHRVVHGMKHSEPEKVTAKLLAELHRITCFDPDHLPYEIALIETLRKQHPRLLQVACFDTAFHYTMPTVAKLLPIPRRYFKKGLRRYGFHGLSYTYLLEELRRLDPQGAKRRSPRKRCKPGRRSWRQVHRYQYGVFADLRIGDE